MATSHFCNGTWRDGTVASCPKHAKLSKKQPSVYASSDGGEASSSSGDSSSNGSSGDSSSSAS